MSVDTTHECPAPGCDRRVPFAQLACSSHWWSIPQGARDLLSREYSHSFGEGSYFEARAECLRALGVPEDEVAALNGGVA